MKTMPPSDIVPVLHQRRTLLSAGVVLLLSLLLALAGPSSGILIAGVLTEGLLILLWVAAAGGYGATLLPLPGGVRGEPFESRSADRRQPTPHVSPLTVTLSPRGERGQDTALRRISAIGLGLGFLSLAQLLLGLAGVLHRAAGFALIAIGLVLLLVRCRKLTRLDVKAWLFERIDWQWLWLLVLPALAIAIVAAYVPPGVLWGDEPHGYDVLEYHLQLPREWYELGRISPLTHNVFSYFPLAMEMHYLLAMQLTGGPWAGMYLAQLMHVTMCALTVAAVYAVARQFADRLPSILAAIACANVPWLALLGPVAYNEGALLFFATLAVGWVMHDRSTTRAWGIAGAFAGFACGTKLTAVPQVLVLVPLVAVITGLIRRETPKTLALRAVLMLSVGAITFSPWLVRNLIWSGNPVFPEAQPIFGHAHFTQAQSERWTQAHEPAAQLHSLDARHRQAVRQIVHDWKFGFLLLPLGVLCALLAIRNPANWMVLALLSAWLIFWLGFTHLQGRFYVIAIPIAALAIATLRRHWQIALAGAGVLAIVVINLGLLTDVYAKRVAPWSRNSALAIDTLKDFLPADVVDLVTDQREMALVGDARPFLYQLPTAKLRYRTVFDVDVKEGESIVQAWLANQPGSPTIVIDPLELERFSKTYKGIPPLPDDFPGPRDRTYILTPQR